MIVNYFCENSNHVSLSHRIHNELSREDEIEARVLMLDWEPETSEWVTARIDEDQFEIDVLNILTEDEQTLLRSRMIVSSRRREIIYGLAFDYFAQFLGTRKPVVVQFNDTSFRGEILARACKNTGTKRVLVQDGFLNFTSKSGDLRKSDKNYGWGSSNPAALAVWGQKTKDAIIDRHNIPADTIHVVGAVNPNFSIPRKVIKRACQQKPRVLWADQPLVDQNKVNKQEWLRELREIAGALSDFEVGFKFHPSTTAKSRLDIRSCLGDSVRILDGDFESSSSDLAKHFDVVFTYYSTIFIEALSSNIPCVVYATRCTDIELVKIAHPLLSYSENLESLKAEISEAAAKSYQGEAVSEIKDFLLGAEGAEQVGAILRPLLQRADEYVRSRQSVDVELFTALRRLDSAQVTVLGGEFGDHIGVAKPIKLLFEQSHTLGLNVKLQPVTKYNDSVSLEQVARSSVVIINSFGVIRSSTSQYLKKLKKLCEIRRIPIVFYCHETEFVFERLQEKIGGKLKYFVQNILSNAYVFCVSDRQATWLSGFRSRGLKLVYNAINPHRGEVNTLEVGASTTPTVMMVGTLQKRKGVDLFSQVADMAAASHADITFVWLGGKTSETDDCYLSENVEWRGHVGEPLVSAYLAQAKAFFLSSADDPLPLSVGEALCHSVPCIVYEKTGFSDFVLLNDCGAVYNTYDASAAYEALRKVLSQPSCEFQTQAVLNYVGKEAFCKRMVVALSEVLLAEEAKRRVPGHVPSPEQAFNSICPDRRSIYFRSALKEKLLEVLDRKLPKFIVRPGARILKLLGII